MANLNSCGFIGRLTADPEMKFTDGGTARTTFRVAVNRYYKDKAGEKKEETTFIPVVCWGNLAENVSNYLSKGREVYLGGRLRIYKGNVADDQGNYKYYTEIVANEVQFLGSKADNTPATTGEAPAKPNYDPDDLPF